MACATQAFALNNRNEAINGDSLKIITFTESSIAEYDFETQNGISLSDAAIHSCRGSNTIGVSRDETTLIESQNIDFSEPSSLILLGVGAVIATLAHWRKSTKQS